MSLDSVGFEGLVGLGAGAQEGPHLINGTELVGGDLHVKEQERAVRGESVGMPTSKDRRGREPEGRAMGNSEREQLGRSRELEGIRGYCYKKNPVR